MFLIIILTILLIGVYKYLTRNFDYWKKRSVPYPTPLPLFGNFFGVLSFRVYIGHLIKNYYNEFKTPYFGLYALGTPVLVIKSPEIIKHVLVKDFKYFCDRSNLSDDKLDPVASKILFLSKNPQWKYMRSKISPAFSITKAKSMVPLINKAANDMVLYLFGNAEDTSLDAKELCSKYATDVIASCAFGIDARCFENENAEFRAIGRKMFGFNVMTDVQQTCYFVAPNVAKLFKLSFFDVSVVQFLRKVILSSIALRRKTQNRRNDIINTVIEIQDKSSSNDLCKFEGDLAVAQAGQFFIAGLDTVALTLSFALYELCLHPHIQNKVRSEIKDNLLKHGEISYEFLQNLNFIDMVIDETLRKYPVLPFLDRICVEDYKVPGSDLVIEKGTPVLLTTFGLHYDPEYFPDPGKFEPQRFSAENKLKLPDCCYLPFGDGQRRCIGEKLGLSIVKVGLTCVLSNFEVVKAADTPVPIAIVKNGILAFCGVELPIKFNKKSLLE